LAPLEIVRHLEKCCGPGNYDYEIEILPEEAEDITRVLDL